MSKVLQSQYRVTLTGTAPSIPGTWATLEGGALTREIGLAWDGGGGYDLLPGKTTADDITITRPYDPVIDDGWLNTLRRNMAQGQVCAYEVSKRALGAGDIAVGAPEVHANCPVRTVRTASTAAGSEATPAMIELVLATRGPTNANA